MKKIFKNSEDFSLRFLRIKLFERDFKRKDSTLPKENSNRSFPKYILLLSLFFMVFTFWFQASKPKEKILPRAVKGGIDLTDWELGDSAIPKPNETDSEGKDELRNKILSSGKRSAGERARDKILNLDGEWEFYWNEFPIQDEKGVLHLSEENKKYRNIPSTWNGFKVTEKLDDGSLVEREVGGIGYATYRLKINLGKTIPIGLRIPELATSYKLYYNNMFLIEGGKVGTTKETSISEKSTNYITLIPDSAEFTLTLLISNFQNNKGGFYQSIQIGSEDMINNENQYNLALELFVIGVLFIMGIYHLALFYLMRDDLSTFYFGFFCVLMCLRTLVTGENFLQSKLPFLSYIFTFKLEYLTFYLGTSIFNEFISVLFPNEKNNIIRLLISIIGIVYSIITLIFNPYIFSSILVYFQLFTFFFLLYSLYIFLKAIYYNRLGAKTVLLGFSLFSLMVINDILYGNNIINTGYLASYGFIFFIFSQSFLLTSRFANAFKQVKYLSENLEKEVDVRTKALEDAKISSEKALQKSNDLNQMIQIVIHSKNIDEMFGKIFTLFSERYGLKTYLLYVIDRKDNFLKLHKIYGNVDVENGYIELLYRNHLSIEDNFSMHGSCVKMKKSILLKKLRLPHPYKPEEDNILEGDCTSIYIIPLIEDGEPYGTITFSDNKFQKSNIQGISKKDREEIENFIKLVSPSIFQSFQKQQIQKAFQDLQETQSQLIEAERLASLGQLVGGIAHEINNPIAVIRSHAELIEHNNQVTLKLIPIFLDSLNIEEKKQYYKIVNTSLQQKEFLTTREERNLRKELNKMLSPLIGDESLCGRIVDHLVTLRLPPPYEPYIDNLGSEKFQNFLSMAEIFKNQANSIASIEISVEKASRVIFALRSYLSTQIHSEKKTVDIVLEIEKALKVYDNYVAGKILVKKKYPINLIYNCISENLLQVWKNLIFNSIQAMFHTERKLEIFLEKKESLPEKLKEYKSSSIVEDSLFQRSGLKEWILIRIIDSGSGIPNDLQSKIFSPFFTTKSTGEGIGLGLYTSKKIVHEHDGAIFFKSEFGSTEFVVALPVE